MKNSGIEWIGDIPVGWEVVPLKRLAKIQTGNTPSKTEDGIYFSLETGCLWIKAENLGTMHPIEKTTEYLTEEGVRFGRVFPPNSVFVCCIASVGKVGFCNSQASCNQQINALIFENAHWKYGFYLTIAQETEYLLNASGNVMKIINSDKQSSLMCPLPPLNEQQKIASFLDQKCAEIDVVIEKTKATIEEYKKLKQSVITEAVTKGIRGNRPMKDSGIEWIGEIPVGWEICKIKNKFSVYSGATPKSEHPEFWDGDILWITPADYKTTEKYITSGKRTISEEGYNSCGTTLVPENSIIFSKRAPIGSVAISRNELCTNQGCLSCVTKGEVNILFYYYVMSSFTEIFELFGSGTTFKEISFDTFSSFYIPNPDLKEQKEIADYLDQKCAEIDTLIAKKTTLLTELETYKKSLIYEYVTGKKEVREDTASTQVAVYSPYFPVIIKVNNLYNALKTFMFGILDKCNYDTGRVKLEKMMFVAQHSIGCDLGNEYSRAELGPLDSLFYQCEYDLVKDGCIIKDKKRNIRRIYYKPGRNNHKYKEEYNRYFADCDTEIDRIINIFKDYDVQKSERIATLFGAWNDAIIDKRQFTDEDIVEDVLNNWHEHKGDYSRKEWLEDLEEMKKFNLIPKGYGKKTVIKKD